MNQFRNIFKLTVPSMILVLCIIGSFVFATIQKTVQPDNPLLLDADASHMLLTTGGDLNISDEALNSEQSADINKAVNDEENETATEETTEVTSELVTQQEETTQFNEVQQSGLEINYPETYEENINPTVAESRKQDTDSNNHTQKAEYGEDSENNVNDNEEDINSDLPGENNKPSGDNKDIVYFTTTIKDGETINSRDYAFEIQHKQPKLTVKSEKIYVNDIEQIQFKGNVLLEDGSNTIRIAVKYADNNGKTFSVYQDYTVYVDLGDIVISTDLCDQTIETNVLTFSVSAFFYGDTLPVKVFCNEEELTGENDNFIANLKSGENTITISAQSGKHTANKSFTINCTAPKIFAVYTNLTDCTVHSESMNFTAYILNGSERSKLTVVVNGKTILGDTNYTVNLNVGNNVIRLKATDKINGETKAINNSFVIRYVPIATDETAPKLDYINVTDGMNVTGSDFTLNLDPIDYQSNRIYYNGITVRLNGMVYPYKWASEYTSYQLWLENGANTLDIRITDNDGRYADYTYTINCNAVADGEKIGEITISIDANVLGLGYIIVPIKVPIYQGESGTDVVTRVLEENGFTYSYSGSLDDGFYLSRISKSGIGTGVLIPRELVNYINKDGLEWKTQKFDDSIGEFDYCQGSGWMYSVNDSFPNFGLSDANFKDRDTIKIRFTLAYGKDIGGFTATGNVGGSNYETTW